MEGRGVAGRDKAEEQAETSGRARANRQADRQAGQAWKRKAGK